jgi:DNA-binding MarR family transcriptional regulator
MKPSDCIFFQLAKASQSAVRYWAQQVAPLGVTAVQAMTLTFLTDADPMTSRDLGEKTQLDSATLTGIIDRLETQGLVVRREHPDDRRAILVALTDSGKETAGKISILVADANREFLKDLSETDQSALRRFLAVIRAAG